MSGDTEISTVFLVLRRIRGTLIGLILIYAISVLGLTLAPGPLGPDGIAQNLSFFHAFYFISYTATTIGFGEIPYAFSEQQRLWVTVCIYLSVIGWTVFIGKLLQIAQDSNLQRAIRTSRFGREVRKLHEPFYIVCGYGETGHRLCAALDRMGYRVVVLEISEEQLADIELQSYRADMPHLCADAANPRTLAMAGLRKPNCRGLISLTNNDACNLAVAISGRLLAPSLPVLARAEHPETAANMASFDTQHIIDPFERFSEHLSLALNQPSAYQLLVWLTGMSGKATPRPRTPPRGHWILLGYGRMTRHLVERIAQFDLPVTVIDLHDAPEELPAGVRWVHGDGTGALALEQAGIKKAAGLIGATANDVNNLSAAVTARQLNPDIYLVVRQHSVANHPLFDSLQADITMIPSALIAHECLAILGTPLLEPFLDAARKSREDWCTTLLQRLVHRFGVQCPDLWSVRVNAQRSPALHLALMRDQTVTLENLVSDPSNRASTLSCEVLLLRRASKNFTLPALTTELQAGDELLLVGTSRAKNNQMLSLSYQHTLQYVLTGEELPGGWIWQHLRSRRLR